MTIISLMDHFDSKTTSSRIMMNMIAVLSEYEHDLSSSVVRTAGRIAARARGVKFGRPNGSGNADAAKSCAILYNNGMPYRQYKRHSK